MKTLQIIVILICFFGAVYNLYKSVKRTGTAFAVGDAVEAFGCRGTVKSISVNGMFVEVVFKEAPTSSIFNIDGKLQSWHKYPSLKKV